jgi:hypothetical protein
MFHEHRIVSRLPKESSVICSMIDIRYLSVGPQPQKTVPDGPGWASGDTEEDHRVVGLSTEYDETQ